MLEITDLHVSIGDREVLHDINLTIPDGETHVMMGPNGSGKTTLLRTIMGFAGNEVTAGSIVFNGEDVTRMPLHERAERGMGMLYQRPPTIAGLKLGQAPGRDRPGERGPDPRRWPRSRTWTGSSSGT